MPLEGQARIVQTLTRRGYNAEREAVTLLARCERPTLVLDRVIEELGTDTLVIRAEDVDCVLDDIQAGESADADGHESNDGLNDESQDESSDESDVERDPVADRRTDRSDRNPSVSTGKTEDVSTALGHNPPETEGSSHEASIQDSTRPSGDSVPANDPSPANDSSPSDARSGARSVDGIVRSGEAEMTVAGDMTGESTGTGSYRDFVSIFRDRLERIAPMLRGRINHRPAASIASTSPGSQVGMVGLVNDVRSTSGGHWLVELEDATGTFPFLVMNDREFVDDVDALLFDEVIAMEGTLADDGGIAFVDSIHFPDVPLTFEPTFADRHVQAALISDVHVGSQEFMADAWNRFADWLHTEEAAHVEYLCIAGDMVEGVGVYPNQDEELDIVDIYDQYEAFNEHLKAVPGDIEIAMIPGNHDAVRLAEPQPGFDDEIRSIIAAHDARIVSNPSTVTLEGVSVLMYHGVSLDEVIAELPTEKASYDEPQLAMSQLLKKRHVAPQFGGHTRLAPETRDYLVIEDVPDVFHAGHVHKLGVGAYHNVRVVNSGCWQSQTDFQKRVNIDPDAGFAPIVDLDTLEVTVQKFS